MPDTTTILSLPMILPAQAQKHVTHNEALLILDAVVQLAVLDRDLAAPPGGAVAGDRYIVAAGASGAWLGQAGKVAVYSGTYWDFIAPKAGWRAWVADEAQIAVYDGAAWTQQGSAPSTVAQFGISATADATNRLTVSAPGVLFNHAGAGMVAKINKATAADTASLAFQTGFSGRAEIGTTGSDDLTIKVSANGSAFNDGMRVAAASGIVSLPQGVAAAGFSLRDGADPSKRAEFVVSGLPTASTQAYSFPPVSGQFALLEGTQTFSGLKTFSGTFTVSAAAATLGNATGTATYGVGSGATLSGSTKTLNLGTGGVSGSSTVVNIGSGVAGAGGSLVVNSPAVSFAASVTSVAMPAAALSANLLGVGGASGDATNRLAVAAPATLLNHAGAGHQLKLNKALATDTASLLFQSGFSGRAEMGTTGSDDFAIRVSADGSAFNAALTVARDTGQVSLAAPLRLQGQASDPSSPQNGEIWLNTASGQVKVRSAGASVVVAGGGGGGVTDGNKGDVTVSGGGATWTVNAATKTGLQIALNQQIFIN